MALCAGCQSRAGIEEFRAYSRSIDGLVGASEPLLDRLSIAERGFYRERIADGADVFGKSDPNITANGFGASFFPEHAILHAASGEPPYTAALRNALATVAQYNRTLLAYADGRALDSLKADAAEVKALAERVLDAAPVAGLFTEPAFDLVRDAATLALAAASREAFRDELMARKDAIRSITDVLIASSPTTFDLLTWSLMIELDVAEGAARATGIARLEEERRLLSEWVVAVGSARVGLDLVVAAIEGSANGPFGGPIPPADLGAIEAALDASTLRIRSINARLAAPPGE